MRSRSSYFVLGLVCFASAGYAAACSSAVSKDDPSELEGDDTGTGTGDTSTGTVDGGGGDETTPGDGGGFNTDASVGDKKVVGLIVEPAIATIVVKNGDVSAASAAFTAKAKYEDGSSAPIGSCVWNVDRIDVGSMTGSTFKASGTAGGKALVECAALGFKATGTADVRLEDTVDSSSGLDEATKKSMVATTVADPTLTKLLYPFDGTVLPKGVRAPELMWNAPSGSDVYAVRLEEDGMTLTTYFDSVTPARAQIPKPAWTKLLDSNVSGGPLKMTLFRLAGGIGGTAYKSATQTWTIANGSLKGTIYYWRINGGRVVRIKPGADTFEDFLKPSAGHSCIACHSVSKNGATIAASYDGGRSPWVTFDAQTGAEKTFKNEASGFQAIAPDGSVVVWGQSESATLKLSNAISGVSLEPSGLGAISNAVMPTFSNDGKTLAFTIRHNGNWLDFSSGDLAVAPFDPATNKFGAHKVLRPSGGRSMVYPSFSPDDQYIAYEDAPIARTRGTQASLKLIKADGTGDVLLDKATNGGVVDIDKTMAYEPTFNPVLAGGYFWVVFVSERQYGNRLTKTLSGDQGTCEANGGWATTPCRSKQLWVSAIDASPKPGVDPSHPGFWLPGQDIADQNMRGYWALDPCKKLGEGCEAGFECCDGACKTPDGGGAKVCVKPPPGTCAATGDKCTSTADCCDAAAGVECIGGVCGKKAPS